MHHFFHDMWLATKYRMNLIVIKVRTVCLVIFIAIYIPGQMLV